MNVTQKNALRILTQHPAQVGRLCGFRDLTDDLHGAWMREIISGHEDMTLQAHRGSYKTTCLSIALAVMMVTRQKQNMIFLRKADNDVAEVLRQVRTLLEGPVFACLTERIYGEPVRLVKASSTELTCDAYASPRGAVQLLGIGTGSSITGKHADVVITDDIVNLKDRVSRAERERIRGIYQELQNIRNRGGRIINTGTPWHKDDAFALMPNIQRYDCYQTGLISKDKLEELRRNMSPSLFAANYELRHIAEENALFSSAPRTVEDAELLRDGIAHIDAAYGGEDFTALTCARRDGDIIYIYGRLWRAHVDTVIDAALSECERLMCAPIYCETNGDKGYLAKEIRRRGMQVRPYPERMNKFQKIATYLRKWWGHIAILDGTDAEYLSQILDYTEDAEHDDAPDSAACVCRLLDRERTALL